MRTAVVPGSFDPMTLGHRDIVERALTLFDRVTVAILVNPDKEGTFCFKDRKEIARLTLAGLERVDIITGTGYLADLARDLGACAIVKGIRSAADLRYENAMAEFNSARYPGAETLYLPAGPRLRRVSSTLARKRLASGGSTDGIMAPEAAGYAKRVLGS
jgi:pantetheine-phosphate adenylyltransferase